MPKQRLVIVGNGMAAARVMEATLERGGAEKLQIAVFGEEPCPSYDRMRLADVMNGARTVEQILHLAPSWYEERGARVHWGERAVLVSRPARTVYGSAGSEERYDALVFATGSSPYFPPIKNLFNGQGKRLAGVCEFRTLADCLQIAALANGCRTVAIVGGGLLGLEAARGLANRACQVALIHRGARLMSEHLDDDTALRLLSQVEAMGIQVLLNRGVIAVLGAERVSGLMLDDGAELPCDLVIIASGLIPNTWLAFQCGLSVERGIAVDNQLRSIDDRRVYALGECAQPRARINGIAAAIRQQAQVIAEQLMLGA